MLVPITHTNIVQNVADSKAIKQVKLYRLKRS